MPEIFNQEDNAIINLVLSQWGSFCNICGVKRSNDNLKIIRKTGESVVLYLNCSSCKTGHFITVGYGNNGYTLQQYSSDLRETEIDKLGHGPITMDDLIDTHLALDKVKNTADLVSIFTKKKI